MASRYYRPMFSDGVTQKIVKSNNAEPYTIAYWINGVPNSNFTHRGFAADMQTAHNEVSMIVKSACLTTFNVEYVPANLDPIVARAERPRHRISVINNMDYRSITRMFTSDEKAAAYWRELEKTADTIEFAVWDAPGRTYRSYLINPDIPK